MLTKAVTLLVRFFSQIQAVKQSWGDCSSLPCAALGLLLLTRVSVLCLPSQQQRAMNLTCQVPTSPGCPTPHRDLQVSAGSSLHYFNVSLHSQSSVK